MVLMALSGGLAAGGVRKGWGWKRTGLEAARGAGLRVGVRGWEAVCEGLGGDLDWVGVSGVFCDCRCVWAFGV